MGGRLRPFKQMQDFRDVLDKCGFRDLGFLGGKFTWCNGQWDGHTVWERLDRAVATIDWLEKFSDTRVVHLECGSLDHKPIVIFPNGIPKNAKGRGGSSTCGLERRDAMLRWNPLGTKLS